MELVIEIAGWIAAGVLLGAYGLLSNGRLSGQGWSFQALNVVGSLLVGVNSLMHEAWPSVSVNVVWLVIGVATLLATRRADDHAAPASSDGAAPASSDGGGTHDGRAHGAAGSGWDPTATPIDVAARTDPRPASVGSQEGTTAGRCARPTLV